MILISEIEVKGVVDRIRMMPDFVASGKYELRFFMNSKSGNFKMYKTGEGVFVRLDDGITFSVSLDMFKHENLQNPKVRLAGDTFEISGRDGYYMKIVGDRIEEFRGEGIIARLSDYCDEPLKFPRKWVVRYMGANITLQVEEIRLLY